LSDYSEGGVALVTAPFILLTAALALAEDFRGRDVFRVLAIVVDLSFDFVPCTMPKKLEKVQLSPSSHPVGT
jgi:hypothetical protein